MNLKRQQERQQGKVAEVHPSTAQAESQGVCEDKFDKFVNIARYLYSNNTQRVGEEHKER